MGQVIYSEPALWQASTFRLLTGGDFDPAEILKILSLMRESGGGFFGDLLVNHRMSREGLSGMAKPAPQQSGRGLRRSRTLPRLSMRPKQWNFLTQKGFRLARRASSL